MTEKEKYQAAFDKLEHMASEIEKEAKNNNLMADNSLIGEFHSQIGKIGNLTEKDNIKNNLTKNEMDKYTTLLVKCIAKVLNAINPTLSIDTYSEMIFSSFINNPITDDIFPN